MPVTRGFAAGTGTPQRGMRPLHPGAPQLPSRRSLLRTAMIVKSGQPAAGPRNPPHLLEQPNVQEPRPAPERKSTTAGERVLGTKESAAGAWSRPGALDTSQHSSPREYQVRTAPTTLSSLDAKIIERIAAGERTTCIASKLYLSRQGVEYHVSKMMERFRVPNRTALVAKAYALGILRSEVWPPRVLQERVN
uniref:Putative response regulator n=1 Tax=Streptomyces viridochromogenes Tue57 TaxID=1160705 RepID=Q93KX2_STRVR|nr:putative response regulator [Streptomyces viridochromogenes Tue57]